MAITITPEEMKKSAVKYRKRLLLMLTTGLEASLKHMAPRPGIRYRETVGEYGGNAEPGPYSPSRKNTSTGIKGRTPEVFLGSVIKEFDPNGVWQSIHGGLLLHGEGLKNVEITQAIPAAEVKSISRKLNAALFSAVRDGSGTTGAALFAGFDTIAAKEIAAAAISGAKKNLYGFPEPVNNSSAADLLKAFYRPAADELQSIPAKLFMSKDIYSACADDYQQTAGAVPCNREFKKTFLEGSDDRCEPVALSNRKGAPCIRLTAKSNTAVGTGNALETPDADRFGAFLVTLSPAAVFGVQYETVSPERLPVGKLYVPSA